MSVKITSLIFGLLLACPAVCAAEDPFVGTWKLNLEKSKYSLGSLPISSENTYEPAPGGGLKLTISTVTANGAPSTIVRIERYDEKPHPVQEERSSADAVSTKRIDNYTIEVLSYKHGKVITRLTRRISGDGKTMTSTSKGTNAQGRKFEEFRFFDRQ
jgi:hypothetical protein